MFWLTSVDPGTPDMHNYDLVLQVITVGDVAEEYENQTTLRWEALSDDDKDLIISHAVYWLGNFMEDADLYCLIPNWVHEHNIPRT